MIASCLPSKSDVGRASGKLREPVAPAAAPTWGTNMPSYNTIIAARRGHFDVLIRYSVARLRAPLFPEPFGLSI